MAAHVLPRLVSYAEFATLPDKPGMDLELHFGQVIEMAQPSPRHVALQHRLHKLLEAILDSSWQVLIEAPYRALPEYDARRSDVAVVSDTRWKTAVTAGSLMGSPELVVEVISPSNRERDMAERAGLCLGTGTVEFWLVDDRRSSVTVTTREGSVSFHLGDFIPLRIASVRLSVHDVFRE
jgi:Uma2 family endonuclease